jgi:aarF domain-containing kinase
MFKSRKDVNFPSPFAENTKDSVLVESFIEGMPITYFENNKHKLNPVIAKLGSEVLFEMIMKNNFIHADCHGGNIFISTEEKPYNFFT